jgi:hypothetical protein
VPERQQLVQKRQGLQKQQPEEAQEELEQEQEAAQLPWARHPWAATGAGDRSGIFQRRPGCR